MSSSPLETRAASHREVERLLGPLDADAVMGILALSPTVLDVERAALHMSGAVDSLPENHQPHGTVLAIVELLTRDDEDEGN